MKTLPFLLAVCYLTSDAAAQKTVTLPLPSQPGATSGDIYGSGTRAVILAHGGRFHKESWKAQAETLARSGFLVLAIAFRGDNLNPDGSPGSNGPNADNTEDVLAAVAYLQKAGVKTISAVGASMGGDAVGTANAQLPAGTLDHMVFLGSDGGGPPEKVSGSKLFILARDDTSGTGPRLKGITQNYDRMSQPKRLLILEGSAHAQFLFATSQGPLVLNEIVRFLSKP